MSLVYDYTSKILTAPGMVQNSDDASRKALLKANCPAGQIDAFLAELKGSKGNAVKVTVMALSEAVTKKLVGKDAFMAISKKHAVLSKIFTATVLKPQFAFQAKDFDLSIHLKGGNIQLWLTYKGGGTTVAIDTAATAGAKPAK